MKKRSALQSLVQHLVDYAGLFPPAGLPMQTVVTNYAEYFTGPYNWMLGRLIIPAARLEEFETLAAHLLPCASRDKPWTISALLPPVDAEHAGFDAALLAIESFNARHTDPRLGLAVVDAVEFPAPSPQHVVESVDQLPENLAAFLEIPYAEDPGPLIESIAAQPRPALAKIRTGGVTPELIPPIDQVARFMCRCAEHNVGFKATAGLHHPLYGEARLTYEANAACATMHGFLNVFVAAMLAAEQVAPVVVEQILSVSDASEFDFSDQQVAWGEFSVDAQTIQSLRQKFAISFGSCSFTEPATELEALQLTDRLEEAT